MVEVYINFIIIIIIITTTSTTTTNCVELSLGGSSPYTSTDKTRINISKRNNTKTQYKQYKTHTHYKTS